MPSWVEANAWISRQTQTHRGHMTAHREVDMYMYPLACKNTPSPHTHTHTHSVTVNALIIDPSLFGLLFDGLCFLSTFKSRNHCSHFHIKIPPPRDMLLCGRLVAWLMSECAHPHKRKSIHKHTLMSLTPLINTHTGRTHACLRAHTQTHVYTVIPLSHATISLNGRSSLHMHSSKLVPASTPGTHWGKPRTPDSPRSPVTAPWGTPLDENLSWCWERSSPLKRFWNAHL